MGRDVLSRLGAPAPFDQEFKFVTSTIFSPLVLGIIRLLLALYTLVTLLVILIHDVKDHSAKSFLSYFTELTYIGLCSYFWASAVQTLAYALKKDKSSYPLQSWPRFLQFLHSLLWTTITNFPFIVTPVFWALLASANTFSTRYSVWENVSVHAMNSAFALFELFFSKAGPQPWWHIVFLILLLGGYVGVAYITHATQGFYTYGFLDPKKEGAKLAAYLVGIPAASVIIFIIVWSICWVKAKLVPGIKNSQHDKREVLETKISHDSDKSDPSPV